MRRYTTQSHPVLQAVSFIEPVLRIDRSLYIQHVVDAGCRVGIRRDSVGSAIGNYLGKVKGQPLGRYPPHFGPRFEQHLPIGLEINQVFSAVTLYNRRNVALPLATNLGLASARCRSSRARTSLRDRYSDTTLAKIWG